MSMKKKMLAVLLSMVMLISVLPISTADAVASGIVITSQPEDVVVEVGKSFTVNVEAEGESLTYQWQYKYPGDGSWSNWTTGGTGRTLKKTMKATYDGLSVRVIITDGSGDSVTSEEATITIGVTSYTVTFDANGGRFATAGNAVIQQITPGNAAYDPGEPFKRGFDFIGWFKDTIHQIVYEITTPVNEDTTVYAGWEETPASTVTFHGGEGGYFNNDTSLNIYALDVKPGESVADAMLRETGTAFEDFTVSNTNTAKIFFGFYTSADFTEESYIKNASEYVPDGNTDIYIRWGETWTVNFVPDGGKFWNYDTQAYDLTEQTWYVLKGTPTEGWVYVMHENGESINDGWYLNPEYSGKKYTQQDIYNYIPEADTTFYEKSTTDVWKMTLHVNSDTGYFGNDETSKTVFGAVKKGSRIGEMSLAYFANNTDEHLYTTSDLYMDADCTQSINYNNVPTQNTDLYLKWAQGDILTFDANGGYFIINGYYSTGSYAIEDGTKLKMKVPTGNTADLYFTPLNGNKELWFDGWYTDAACTPGNEVTMPVTAAGDAVYYAKWKEASDYSIITFYCNGGSINGSSTFRQYVEAGQSVGSITPYYDDKGYNGEGSKTFKGWYFDSELTMPAGNLNTFVPSRDIKLYAKWEDKWAVTWDAGEGGHLYENGPQTATVYLEKGTSWGSYFSPIYDTAGMAFDGWYTTPTFDEGSRIDEPWSYVPTSDITLYAKCSDGWVITYNANGGYFNGNRSVTEKAYSVLKGGEMDRWITAPVHLTDSSLTVEGWYTDAACTEGNRVAGPEGYGIMPTEDMTVYAKWTEGVKVTWNALDGYINNEGTSVYTETFVKGGELEYCRYWTGYPDDAKAIEGWYYDEELIQPVEFPITVNEDISFYAKWVDIYTVTWDAGAGYFYGDPITHITSNTYSEGDYIGEIGAPSIDDDNLTFDCWCTDEALTTEASFPITAAENRTFYARYTSDLYRVTLDANGGYFDDPSKTTYLVKVKSGDSIGNAGGLPGWSNGDGNKYFRYWYYINAEENEVVVDLYNYTPDGDITIYAKWVDAYRATFDPGEGGHVWTDITGTYTVIVEVGDPIGFVDFSLVNDDKHMAFAGWYMSPDFSEDSYVQDVWNYVPEGDVVFYAKWEEGYSVTFDANGELFDNGEQQYVMAVIKGSAADEYYAGYYNYDGTKTFDGWYTDPECTNLYAFSTAVTEDLTLYAKWNNVYKITWNAGAGYFNGSPDYHTATINRIEGEEIWAAEGLKIDDDNLVFDCWCTDEALTTEASFPITAAENMTFYARYTSDLYKVIFDANGGYLNGDTSITSYLVKVKHGESIGNKDPYASWNDGNKSFGYWYYLDADENEVLVNGIYSYTPEGDITLYAKWLGHYTVTWDAGDGYVSEEGTHVYSTTITEAYVVTVDEQWTGYPDDAKVFGYWYLLYDGVEIPCESYYTVREDMTFYAKWLDKFTVTFNTNGHGTAPDSQTVTENNYAEDPGVLYEDGYSFGGWYTEAECTNEYNFGTPVTGDLILYAKWTEVVPTYTITFYSNDGSDSVVTQEISAGVETVLNENPFTRENYTFIGWSTDSSATEVMYSDQATVVFNEDITLYAVWENRIDEGTVQSVSGDAMNALAEEPELVEEPEAIEIPEVTEVPEATEMPEVTEVPEATAAEEPAPEEAAE